VSELERWHRERFPDRDQLITLLNLRAVAFKLYVITDPRLKPQPVVARKPIDQSWRKRKNYG
jgi:hypothetical protein